MELTIKEGVVHTLQRGDTVVITLATAPSPHQRLLFQRQLQALLRQQKIVILDPGMTFAVYREPPPAAPALPAAAPPETPMESPPPLEQDARPSVPRRR